jgi:hypothetical protein
MSNISPELTTPFDEAKAAGKALAEIEPDRWRQQAEVIAADGFVRGHLPTLQFLTTFGWVGSWVLVHLTVWRSIADR